MEQNKSERRRHGRVGQLLCVSYAVINRRQKNRELIVKNISGGGMKIPLKENLIVGTLLEVQLELLKEKKKILLKAKIVWIKPASSGKKYLYEAGVEFINVDSAERTMISNCVQYLNRDELLK